MIPIACLFAVASLAVAEPAAPRQLGFEERVAAQRAIEEVYWRHRIWPAANRTPKPPLGAVLPDEALRARVEDTLERSSALTAEQLQAELDRMARDTRDPEVLRELFAALGDDPFVIAETLARQALVDRVLHDGSVPRSPGTSTAGATFSLPETASACTIDTWAPTPWDSPTPRTSHRAIWTGAEMIVWGGSQTDPVYAADRYTPSTDSWAQVILPGESGARKDFSLVWTGSEAIVWGGRDSPTYLQTGGRFDPQTDTWTPIPITAQTPSARNLHTAVWTGSEMIVWGGNNGPTFLSTGGRFNPSTGTWTATSAIGAPSVRRNHTAVWTGSEMIVWGGTDGIAPPTLGQYLNTGGKYAPGTDTWLPTSTTGVPLARESHTAVWTGTRMIVWGGRSSAANQATGALYDPSSDGWTPTSATGAPSARSGHSAVWTGSDMIVWSGVGASNSGGRYRPASDTWLPTSTAAGAPGGRNGHTAVWTGTEMIVWGGTGLVPERTGGRYDPETDGWLATSIGVHVPAGRSGHAAVWTGAEMIVWGGNVAGTFSNLGARYSPALDVWADIAASPIPGTFQPTAVWTGTEMIVWKKTGARYNPLTNSWLPVATAGAPDLTQDHAAVWTGSEMIVWGGYTTSAPQIPQNTGGRYAPASDTWAATSTAGAPAGRGEPAAVWTGSEMVVWGGTDGSAVGTGGRYRPNTDTWLPVSMANAPSARFGHTAVWTGGEMLVWGGFGSGQYFADGARYRPLTDTWLLPMSNTGAPTARAFHTAIWTGDSDMVVWGGHGPSPVGTGARYTHLEDTWVATSLTGAPAARDSHTAVWTGSEMIVWGGDSNGPMGLSTGGRYCACLAYGVYFLDADGDGFGLSSVSTSTCTGTAPSGYTAVAGDCDDGNGAVYPNAPEVNDGVDNQCPGNTGYGLRDEISGLLGFLTAGDKTKLSWTAQAGAGAYLVARSPYRDFHAGCQLTVTPDAFRSDPQVPPLGGVYYYLVRANDPVPGTWGKRSSGVERTVCAGCDSSADACDDANACTTGDACSGTVCVSGAPRSCDDAQLCTTDACNAVTGCLHTNNTVACSDGNACTSGDVCGGGSCQSGPPLNCDDGNVCTTDSCSAATGCAHANNTLSCNDGNRCTSGDVCAGGACAGTAAPAANHLVISQIQVEGDGGTPTEDEFIELYNPTSLPISLIGRSLQFKTNAGGATYFKHDFTSGTVPAYGWFLVAGTAYNGLVPSDQVHSEFPMAPGAGNLFLVNDLVLLSGACPVLTTVLDKVAWGTGICPEGTAAPQPPGNDSVLRKPGGTCGNGTDTNNNLADYLIQSPATPRNSSSTQGGICATLNCDDGNPCTVDSCNPGAGCVHTTPPPANHLVISQVQVEGDGATPTEDEFIEIYNPTSAPINLVGKSLQFKTNAGGATYFKHNFTSGTVPAHGWFLVVGTTYNGSVPTDQVNTAFPLAPGAGNLFLVNDQVLLSGACPVLTTVLDKVAWGTGLCPEGTVAPQPPANNSILRKPGGTCGNGTDTDDNVVDYLLQSPATPRNTASPPQP